LKVIGTITKLKEMDGMILLTVRHSSKIEVVLFEDDNIFSVGDRVSVSGKIEEYKDSYEIIGDSIELVG